VAVAGEHNMPEFMTAVGLAVAIEGALYALFPAPMKKMMMHMMAQPHSHMRIGGIAAATAGVGIIWLVRG